jgi:probable DNA repair protein
LKRLRPKLQRSFQAALNPAGEFDDPERSFHVSLGPPLDGYPLVRAALLMLEFSLAGLALPRAGMLLRSPFLAGAEAEWSQRALLDAKLRRKGAWDLRAQGLREAAGSCPLLQQALLRFEKALERVSGDRRPSEWAGHFSKLLEALGWPGERPLNRREFQVAREWRQLLSDFAALDCVAPPMTSDTAFWRLREAAASTVFQVENEGSNVQIMGMLEASGLRFDHVWIMGLDDETLPAPPNPNPFLPLALQQELDLPQSSPDRELAFAKELIDRLIAGAPHVVLSYPERDGDRQLAPSPLLPGDWLSAAGDAMPSEKWMAGIRASTQFEQLVDQSAPPVLAASIQTGGTYLFKDMAACPFRGFAKHRLGAKNLEDSTLGLSYADHGTGVHKALELIWRELGSHARLVAMDSAELQRLVARCVAAAIANLPARLGRKLEQRRLEKLLIDWLAIEKTRSPFVAHKPEQESLVEIGGLQVKTRADRVDQLPDGREIILDYKTGQLNLRGWDTDRPDEPQLPLYCATSARPVAGAALVSIRVGELGFRGLTDAGISLPGMKEMRISEPVAFSRQVVVWKQVLEGLARNFQAGRAEVDPKEHACDHCGLWALCRIREFENDRG